LIPVKKSIKLNKLLIYKASAGSGKTHLLTGFYLTLAFENPNNFSKILAVTFTNKAAEEMKERIVEEIDNIIKKGQQAGQFAEIQKNIGGSENELISKALQIRNNILHNYSQFSVGTIDSFVQKIARAFSFELGVNSTYKIEMDTEKSIDDLVRILYSQIGKDDKLRNWLLKFSDSKIREGKSWIVRDEISLLAREIFKENFQGFISQFSINQSDESFELALSQLNSLTLETVKSFENQMDGFSKKATGIIKNTNPCELPPGRNFDTIVNYLINKIHNKSYEPDTVAVQNSLNGIENWYAKSAKPIVINYIENIYPKLVPILENVINLYTSEYLNYMTAKSIRNNFFTFGILGSIAKLLPEYRNENNLMFISDASLLLKQIIGNNDAPFIYEKIGNRYNHILIDEFQDTSGFQWTNFKPLIENSLSENNRNLIVGDIKQSIYRWRGGDFKLLLRGVREDIDPELIHENSLDTNWRSKKNIIDFNNLVFEIAAKLIQNQLDEEIIKTEDIKNDFDNLLSEAYNDSYQMPPVKEGVKGGRVKIKFLESEEEDENFKETCGKATAIEINELLLNKNYEARDFCILVRTNGEAKSIVDSLLKYQTENTKTVSYEIISGESLFLSNNTAIRIIIDSLKYLNDNNDTVSLASLVFMYQKLHLKSDMTENDLFTSIYETEKLKKNLPAEFINVLDELRKYSIYELCEKLISGFGLNTKSENFPYLGAFQDILLDYSKRNSSDLVDFLEWWNLKGETKSLQMSDKQNAVKVMTIHKSKGLAFRCVIVPFANWKFDHGAMVSPNIWAKPSEQAFDIDVPLPIKYSANLKSTYFSNAWAEEKSGAALDALNVLYVAFTRPKEELIVFAKAKKARKKISDVSDLLYAAVSNDFTSEHENQKFINPATYYNSENQIFELKTNYLEKDSKKYLKDEIGSGITINSYPSFDITERLKISSDSDDFRIESVDYLKEKVDYGSLMHLILSKIKHLEDADSVLDNLYFAGYLSEIQKQELAQNVREILSRPVVKNWFSQDSEVFNEREIISKSGTLRIPDRVVIQNNEIVVIDFKFGEIRKEHEIQIKEYMQLLFEIYQKRPKGILYYAEKNKITEVSIDEQLYLFES